MKLAWYTKNMKNTTPHKKIHYSVNGSETLCGIEINNPRWYLCEIGLLKADCYSCLLNFEIEKYIGENRNICNDCDYDNPSCGNCVGS